MYLEHTKLLLLLVVLVALLLIRCQGDREMPSAGHTPAEPLPPSMKGYELYSWQMGREWYFTLMTGTNRLKTYQEITLGENNVTEGRVKITVQGIHDLEATLDQLPSDTQLAWLGPQTLKRFGVKPGDLTLPPRRVIDEIESHCAELGIHLEISR